MKKIVFGMMIGMTLVYADFSRSAAGVVTDNKTKLQWQDDYNTNVEYRASWSDALNYCHNLQLDGGGWRLPNINELKSIIRDKVTRPTMDSAFQNTTIENTTSGYQGFYWSSTTRYEYDSFVWIVNFAYGVVTDSGKGGHYFVRCVRDGQ